MEAVKRITFKRNNLLRTYACYVFNSVKGSSLGESIQKSIQMYEGWNFNSGNYLFTTDTK